MAQMTPPHPDPALDALLGRLREARRLHLAVDVLNAALAGLAAGLALLCAALVLRLAPLAEAMPFAVGAGLAATGLWLAVRLAGLPSLARFGVAADRLLAGDEQIRTAMDVSARGEGQGAIPEALLAATARLAPRLDPRALAPAVDWRLAALAAALALATLFALRLPQPESVAPSPAAATLSQSEQQVLVTELEDLALAFEAEAVARNSQYLEAVARQLRTLSREVAADPAPSRAGLGAELSRLETHAAAGLAQSAPAPDRPIPLADLGALAARLEAGAIAGRPTATPSSEPLPQAGQRPDGPAQQTDAIQPAAPARREATPEGELPIGPVETPCQIEVDDDCTNPADTNYAFDVAPPSGAPGQGLGTPSDTEAAVAMEGGMRIGAANQSGAGDSVEAGSGTQPLAGPAADEVLFALEEFLSLSAERLSQSAARAQIEVAPDPTLFVPPSADPAIAPSPDWRRQPEAPIAHDALDPARRDILARYFERSEGE